MKMNSIKNYFQSPIKENVETKIVENMTAVIKSGKKKRKRNKLGNNESVISDISQTLSNHLKFESPNNNIENENEEYIEVNVIIESHEVAPECDSSKAKNVFEVMMDARNRVIGANSNGIILDPDPGDIETTSASIKHKRKLMLEKWCEEKGKKERMLKEDAETELINKKMEKRAERLKKLLTNKGNELNKTDENKNEPRKKKTKIMAKKKLEMEEEPENETSPTNKRDILGYFPKLNGSLEEKNDNIRPRRSCANNKSYTFDLSPQKKDDSESDTTTQHKKSKRSLNSLPNGRSKKQRLDSDNDVEIEIIDADTPRKLKAESKNIKLAPLFIKQVPKPAVDPEVLKARQEFLMSGIPDSMRLEIARQKTFDDEYELNYSFFPEISHVRQLDSMYHQNMIEDVKIKFLAEFCDEPCIESRYENLKLGLVTNCNKNVGMNLLKFSRPKQINKIPRKMLITLIKNLKSDCNNYPVYRCYKQLKLKRKQNGTAIPNGDVVILKDDVPKNDYQLYNERFKPKYLNEIYINYRECVELKRFLSNWQENYYSHKYSDDDSVSNSVSSSVNPISNFVVLVGPYGCGKTNSVYAMAHEMNFKVLEINCGSKRTGKKMLQKLHEATQSHNVHKHNTNSQKTDDTDSRDDLDVGKKKLALVLIEDADVVYEQDDGFISAINQLISTSKRPVILVSNNPLSNHLLKFIEQNSIFYDAPSLVNVTKYITLLGLVENCFLDYGELGKLIQYNQNDLRKTINMVQFYIQSGGDRQKNSNSNNLKPIVKKVTDTFGLSEMLDVEDDNSKFSWIDSDEEGAATKRTSTSSVHVHRHTKIFDFFIKDQNSCSKIPFYDNFNTLWLNVPAIFLSHRCSKTKTKRKVNKTTEAINTLNNINNFYDNISVALVLDAENINHDYSFSCDLSKEIVSTIVENSMQLYNVDYKNYDVLLNNKRESLDLLYNNLNSSTGCSSSSRMKPTASIALDYEPYLRSMCRIEKERQNNTDRRSTRFYHYLRNSINTCSFGTEHFDKHAYVLNDQLNKNAINEI